MAEDAGRKHRQRDHLVAARGQPAEDLGARHFAGIEIEIFSHAVENLPRLVDGEKVEIDTFGFDFAGIERRHAVIEAAGERDRNFGHEMTPAHAIPGLAETLSRPSGPGEMPRTLANRWRRPPSGGGILRPAVVVMRAAGEEKDARFCPLSAGQRRPPGAPRGGWCSDFPSSCTGRRPWFSTPRGRRPSSSTAAPRRGTV